MISFRRTQDYDLVRHVLTHPRIYPAISDDASGERETFKPIESEALWYVVADHEERGILGLFLFAPENSICWKVHTCLLPIAWGSTAKQAGRAVIQWTWQNTPCLRIVTDVPADNALALKFALACGLEVIGINEKSFLRHGVLLDQVFLGISKPSST